MTYYAIKNNGLLFSIHKAFNLTLLGDLRVFTINSNRNADVMVTVCKANEYGESSALLKLNLI